MQRKVKCKNPDQVIQSGKTSMRIYINKLIKAKENPYPQFELKSHAQKYLNNTTSTNIKNYLLGMEDKFKEMSSEINDNQRLILYVNDVLNDLREKINKTYPLEEAIPLVKQQLEEVALAKQQAEEQALAIQKFEEDLAIQQRAVYEAYAKQQAEEKQKEEDALLLVGLLPSGKRKRGPEEKESNLSQEQTSNKTPSKKSKCEPVSLGKNASTLHGQGIKQASGDGKRLNQKKTPTISRE